MIDGKKIIAIIPARGGSKGLLRKNILILNKKPLIGWPIFTAKGSKYIDKVIVSTDDQEIKDIAIEQGAEVPFLRPKELATDKAHRSSVILHAIRFFTQYGETYDYIVFLEPTSPLTETEDIDSALEMLVSKREIADSIVGVSKVEATHPAFDVFIDEKGLIRPYIGQEFKTSLLRQDISDLYFFEGSLYISSVEGFLRENEFYHKRTLSYIVPKWKSLEIDDIVDFICIEAIMKNLDVIKTNM